MKRQLGLIAALLCSAAVAAAQETDIRSRLIGAGAPEAFVDQVVTIVEAARAEGLPTEPLENKAVEGWAKRHRVPPGRVVQVLEQMQLRLRAANQLATQAQVGAQRRGAIVAAAAEALGRGMTAEQVRDLIQSAPTPAAAAAGLTVAASLAAQGLDRAAAVQAVRQQLRQGGPPEQVFELPSAVAEIVSRGTPMSDVARQIMQGGGLPLPGGMGQGQGQGGRPEMVPPARGPLINPPGQQGNQGRGNQGGNKT